MTITRQFFLAWAAITLAMLANQTPGEQEVNGAPQPVVLQAGKGGEPSFSAWGPDELGLRCRVKLVGEIEQGMPLEATFEWAANPKKLPANVKQLNSFLYPAYLSLTLINVKTGKKHTVVPYDPTAGMSALDTGKTTLPLDGSPAKPWQVQFPLLTAGAGLEPGQYEGTVRFSFSKEPTGWWHGTKAAWETAGFWSGTVETGTVTLTVHPATPKTKTFFLPKTLRLDKEWNVRFYKKDAEAIQLPVRNGYFVGAHLYRNGVLYQLSGVPQPDDVNHLDQWLNFKGGAKVVEYTFEVFETADRPEHHWHPGPGSGGYQVLWKKTFAVATPK